MRMNETRGGVARAVQARSAAFALAAGLALVPAASASDPLDDVADAVRDFTLFETPDGQVSLDFDLYLTMDNLFMSQPPPGIIVNPDTYLPSPRLSILGQLDVSDWMTLFALGRVDRGFDPTDGDAEVRPDEYYLQLDPAEGHLRFTAGKFGTSYGQWARRYFEWDNPMTNAPLAYEWVTTVGDGNDAPTVAPSRAAFLNRKNQVIPRNKWLTAIWGPSYTTGFRFDGTSAIFDYAFEVKNNALSSRPTEWDLWNHGFYGNALTYTGRFGVRPVTDWNVGVSGSSGAYLVPNAPGIPAGSWTDYSQQAAGIDVSWAHGPVETWAEAHWVSFEVPGPVGAVGLWTWFVESKWKFMPGWWTAGRFNQQLYDDIADGFGGTTPWGNDVWRVDWCVGWHVDRTATIKFQYSYTDESGPVGQGRNLFDVQLVFAF
jgi:hypothetical protein